MAQLHGLAVIMDAIPHALAGNVELQDLLLQLRRIRAVLGRLCRIAEVIVDFRHPAHHPDVGRIE